MRYTLSLLAGIALVSASCGAVAADEGAGHHTGRAPAAGRYSRQKAQADLARLDQASLVIGVFPFDRVVDGDTLRVEGLDQSLRLVGLDAEETFKHDADRRDAAVDFAAYLRARRGDAPRPVKSATPVGEDAKHFAERFFAGVTQVRLERDDLDEVLDRYHRYLAYAFVEKNGRWINYNVECVRAGMSPYFTKYGRSRRFHDELVAAEREARAARRGIWDPSAKNYGDYDERKAWWDARADFVAAFEAEPKAEVPHIVLSHGSARRQLEQRRGGRVAVLGLVSAVRAGERGPTRVLLGQPLGDLPLVFFDKALLARIGIARWTGEFVVVRGKVTEYERRDGSRELQIIVNHPDQITLSPVPGLVPAPAPGAP